VIWNIPHACPADRGFDHFLTSSQIWNEIISPTLVFIRSQNLTCKWHRVLHSQKNGERLLLSNLLSGMQRIQTSIRFNDSASEVSLEDDDLDGDRFILDALTGTGLLST
jgi:hypothetical protein